VTKEVDETFEGIGNNINFGKEIATETQRAQ
jgi:hypothetical protein